MCDTAGSAQAHRQVPDAGRKFPSYLKHTTGSWDSPVLGFSFLLALLVPLMDLCCSTWGSIWLWNRGPLYTTDFHLCFGAADIFLHLFLPLVCSTSPLALPLHFLWADSHLCCLLRPKSPACLLSTPCWPHLLQDFHPLLFPWSLSLTVTPSGLCLLFQFIFSALISCLSSQMYLSKQSLSAFPSVLGESHPREAFLER